MVIFVSPGVLGKRGSTMPQLITWLKLLALLPDPLSLDALSPDKEALDKRAHEKSGNLGVNGRHRWT